MIGYFVKKRQQRGFTLVELMIVVAIIAILAAIAIPQFASYRARGYNTTARADVKNAYTAAQAYFTDFPAASVTVAKIAGYGYAQSSGVTLAVSDGSQSGLAMTSSHANGNKTYSVNASGQITP